MVLDFIAVVIAASAPVVFPVFRLPEPTGPYAVGSASFEWACAVDEASEQVTTGVWAELRFVAQDMVEGELPRALAGRSAVDTVT